MFSVPRSPPTNFTLKPDNAGSGLIATWKPPRMANGQITFHLIKFRKVGSSKLNVTKIGVSTTGWGVLLSLAKLPPFTCFKSFSGVGWGKKLPLG